MEPGRLERIFGRNLLGDAAQAAGFAELTGDRGHKPFECVGERAESAAAMRLLAGGDAAGFLDPSPEHCLPERFEAIADALR
jgi:UDP-N-acetyl-alpha-D-muramoyl-L-alanyl-L-glutamate epimerase